MAHDVVVLDGRAYCSYTFDGFAIYDVTVPRLPRLLAHKTYPNSLTHNAWPSEDRRYLFTTDENVVGKVGGHVHVWDLTSLPQVTQVTEFGLGARTSVVHNAYVRGPLLFLAYYREGLRVCEVSDPRNPREIARYDTYPAEGAGCFGGAPYAGAYGVYAWDPQRVLVSDIDSGAYVLRLDAVPGTLEIGSPGGAGPGSRLLFSYGNRAGVPVRAFGLLLLTGVNQVPLAEALYSDVATLQPGAVLRYELAIPALPSGYGLDVHFTAFSGLFEPLLAGVPRMATLRVP